MNRTQFTLISPAFVQGDFLPVVNTCDGPNLSPFLAWTGVPGAANSFALIMDDPDALGGTFTHWLRYDIPPEIRELPFNDHETGIAGRNDFGIEGYGGPCPPLTEETHRYYFRIFALDIDSLKLAHGAKRPTLDAAMKGHVLGESILMGRYSRLALERNMFRDRCYVAP
jgi:Raf kinase inhibitor-like YbhB/YbcL family protein